MVDSMLRKSAFMLIIALSCQMATASDSCERPDSSFGSFLVRFKNDKLFRESRLLLPLHFSYADSAGTTKEEISLTQIRERKMAIIRGDADAHRLKGSEGTLCESDPIIKKNQATFGQYSCGTDVYTVTVKLVVAKNDFI